MLVKDTDYVFLHYPSSSVKPEFSKLLYNGNPLKPEWLTEWDKSYQAGSLRIYDSDQVFAGIYRWDGEKKDLRPAQMFLP